jgi:REP element-mobilizing transposase RayT
MPIDGSVPPLPEPLAYFLTWTTYGTWLPGDERGWVERRGKFEAPNRGLERHAELLQVEDRFILTPTQRRIVEATIAKHCELREWHLWIARALSNHVHVVVTAKGCDADDVLKQFKAWCTRRLKETNAHISRKNCWTERGSTRYINDEDGLEQAIVYVRDFQ